MTKDNAAEDWVTFFRPGSHGIASVLVNVALREFAPDAARPCLVRITVYLHQPRPDGLSDSSEFEALCALEDHLIDALSKSVDVIWPGRITANGVRQFYVYASMGGTG